MTTVISFPSAPKTAAVEPREAFDISNAYDYFQLALWLGITLALPFASF